MSDPLKTANAIAGAFNTAEAEKSDPTTQAAGSCPTCGHPQGPNIDPEKAKKFMEGAFGNAAAT